MNDQEEQIPIRDSQEPSEEGNRLVSIFADIESKQLDFLDESGKSVIERIATFLTVLFAITAFSNNFPPVYVKNNFQAKYLIIITLVLYLSGLGAAMWSIQPRYYKYYQYNVSRLRTELDKITKHKMFWVRVAGVLFAQGSVSLAVLIIVIILPL